MTHCMAPKSVPKAKRLMTSIVSHISAWSMSTFASGPSCCNTAANSTHAATVTGNPALHDHRGNLGVCLPGYRQLCLLATRRPSPHQQALAGRTWHLSPDVCRVEGGCKSFSNDAPPAVRHSADQIWERGPCRRHHLGDRLVHLPPLVEIPSVEHLSHNGRV